MDTQVTEFISIIQSLMAKGFDLRAISNTIGTSKATLNRILQGENIRLDYPVKARLLFLHHYYRNRKP